jgi:hypothetical protein
MSISQRVSFSCVLSVLSAVVMTRSSRRWVTGLTAFLSSLTISFRTWGETPSCGR